ncbi:MAG TPA: HEAT repeat domain-containing protein [Chloroflexota bacterium]|nr:HEAT repeat domain-containing protein [Chloroflexota bacterium]
MRTAVSQSFRRVFVDGADLLYEIADELAGADAIGLDVEMGQRIERLPGGVTRGKQLLGLIQIAGNGLSAIVDPIRIVDLSPLAPMMRSPTIKVVLGGATDIQLLEEHGLTVLHVADLAEMAVSVFGHKEEGMRALADRALGVQIDKSIRREDWLRRPINPAMLSYAHRDAELTLRLYRWFQEHHPRLITAYTRRHFSPALSPDMADWIRRFLTKRVDAARLLKELGIDPEKDAARLVADVETAMSQDLSPGQQRRLIRLIGELRLKDLYDRVRPHADSDSSVFRSSAARTLGRLGEEKARPVIERLLKDDIPDVVVAAHQGLKDLDAGPDKKPKPKVAPAEKSPDLPVLKPEAIAALARLRMDLDPAE